MITSQMSGALAMNRAALETELKAAAKRVKRCERERRLVEKELAGLLAEKTDGNLLAGIADDDGGAGSPTRLQAFGLPTCPPSSSRS
jgi:hypothetical protein